MEIVILDGYTTNPGDLSWESIERHGSVKIYDHTADDTIIERSRKADILVVNKVRLTSEILTKLPRLKCICLLATGYNNIDLPTCQKQNIQVFNAKEYSTTSVAQQVFAGILHIIHRIDLDNDSVQKKKWANQTYFSYQLTSLTELKNKTLGIYGFGHIGQAVGQIGCAFGMKVIALHKHPQRDRKDWVTFVNKEELLEQSDILSLHAPLNDQSYHFINKDSLNQMKPNAILVNTGRGGLIQEKDLSNALKNKQIGAAYLDVLTIEPPALEHPLYDKDNCFMTPHHAWASKEARVRLMDMVADNIGQFKAGNFTASLIQ